MVVAAEFEDYYGLFTPSYWPVATDKETAKPFIKYLRDCQSCLLCEMNCPAEAIYVSPDYERRIPMAIYY